jgi:hypothetical protein
MYVLASVDPEQRPKEYREAKIVYTSDSYRACWIQNDALHIDAGWRVVGSQCYHKEVSE